ncbi:hypothetical protein ABT369_15240 [Dactylosporangium sp. NPDC000244]|uniref:hypothetical protein n=1 Tax=Dactylosporangium sp. NPDC000244 TaxID=3154365 RepID=UPI00331C30C1
MDPSIPNEPGVDRGRSIPRSRSGENEVLEGEVIGKGVPIGQPRTGPPPPPDAPARKPRKPGQIRRTVLWTLLAIVVFGLLAGGVTAWVFYNKAAEPDRGNPTATLRQYLDARFNTRDAARASVFTCSSSKLSEMDAAISDVERREQKDQIRIRMFTTEMTVTASTAASATVRTIITYQIPEEGGRSSGEVYTWDFGMTVENGWRVCSAAQLRPSSQPPAS